MPELPMDDKPVNNQPSKMANVSMGFPFCVPMTTVNLNCATPKTIMQQFISQYMCIILRNELKSKDGPNHAADHFFAMSSDLKTVPDTNPGISIDSMYGYRFIPHNHDPPASPILLRQHQALCGWAQDPANHHALAQVEQLLLTEIKNMNVWERYKEKENIEKLVMPARITRYSWICARLRLEAAVINDITGYLKFNPATHCRFGVCGVSRQGTLTIRWVFLPWSSSLNALLREAVICLPTAYAPGAFELATAIADLRERLAIFGTSNDRANAVRAALDAKPIHPPDSVFDFSFSKPGVNHIGGRKWVRVDSEKKFEAVMKAAKENTFGLLLIRPWQMWLHILANEVEKLVEEYLPIVSSNDQDLDWLSGQLREGNGAGAQGKGSGRD